MPNDEMSREEAERWLAELTANPDRMSAKMFQEGYEASLRKSGLREAEISPLLRKARRKAHPVVPGSPICGMRMPSAAGARGHLVAASDRRLDSPAGPKGRRYWPPPCG